MLTRKLQGAGGVSRGPNTFGFVSGSESDTQTLDTELVIPYPAGTKVGDLLILVVSVDNSDDLIATPSGWTERHRRSGQAGDTVGVLICTITATDTETSGSLTLTTQTNLDTALSDGASAVMANFGDGGVVSSGANSSSGAADPPSLSGFVSTDLSVIAYGIDDLSQATTVATGYTMAKGASRSTTLNASGVTTSAIMYRTGLTGAYDPAGFGGADLYMAAHFRLDAN